MVEPNAEPPVLPNGEDAAAGADGAGVLADVSAMVNPGYAVFCLTASLYMSHQAQRSPSCVRTHRPGSGVDDSCNSSSEGMGL